MNFELSEEQVMVRDTLASFLSDNHPFEKRRAIVNSADGFDQAIWDAFAGDLGILAAPFPHDIGGFGGGTVENMIIMEELGKALALEPWLETVVMAGTLLSGGGPRAEGILRAIIAGEAIAIPAFAPTGVAPGSDALHATKTSRGFILSGTVPLVRSAARATHFIVAAAGASASAPTLFVVPADAAAITAHTYPLIDGGRCADLVFDNVELSGNDVISDVDEAPYRLAKAFDAGVFALCAESVGIQRKLLEWSVDYAKQRKQFGRPIGEFQVLQHLMAEMFIKVEESTSMMFLLTAHLDDAPEERAKFVSAAKVLIDQSGRFVGEAAVQIHGGMGMTKELPIADYFSRLVASAQQLGSTEYHFQRYEAASFGV